MPKEEIFVHYRQLITDYLNAPQKLKERRYGRMLEAEVLMTDYLNISRDTVSDIYDSVYNTVMSERRGA